MTLTTPSPYEYRYHGPGPDHKAKIGRLLQTWRGKGPHNVRIEFEDGTQTICPMRCLRKIKATENPHD